MSSIVVREMVLGHGNKKNSSKLFEAYIHNSKRRVAKPEEKVIEGQIF